MPDNNQKRSVSPYESLARYVVRLGVRQIAALSLEDVALFVAFYESMLAEGEREAEVVAPVVDAWLREPSDDGSGSFGNRRQPIMRIVVEELAQKRVGKLNRPQLDFVAAVLGLAERAPGDGRFRRVLGFAEPSKRAIAVRRSALTRVPGLEGLCPSVSVLTPVDTSYAPTRHFEAFGGLSLRMTGSYLHVPGTLKFTGDLGDDTLVEVEEGDVFVNGAVKGALSAPGNIDVAHNICGTVVSRYGAVRTRDIITGARVVAKAGSVACRSTQVPRLVFAGDTVRVEESTFAGAYKARRISIGDKAFGGDFEVAGSLRAKWFRHSPGRPLTVVLRAHLNCEDYGESIGHEARSLLSSISETEQHLSNTRRMLHLAEQEQEQLASIALLTLCGGSGLRGRVEGSELARRRLACLDRIIEGYNALGLAVEGGLAASMNRHSAGEDDVDQDERPVDAQPVLDEIEQEIDLLFQEHEVDSDLEKERDEIVALTSSFRTRPAFKRAVSLYADLRSKVASWRRQHAELRRKVEQTESELGAFLENLGSGHSLEGSSRVQVLDRIIAGARSGAARPEMKARLDSPPFRMLCRNVHMRAERRKHYEATISRLEEKLRATKERLERDYQILPHTAVTLKGKGEGSYFAEAVGLFEPGVAVAVDRVFLNMANLPATLVSVVGESSDQPLCFRRDGDNQIRRRAAC